MKGLGYITKELERHWSPKEKTHCKRAPVGQIATEPEVGLGSAGAGVEQGWGIPASTTSFTFHLLSLETFCLLNKSRSRPRLSIGFRLMDVPAAW